MFRSITKKILNKILANKKYLWIVNFKNKNGVIKKNGVDLVYKMALTGEGTEACLDKGCLPVLVHYHQPIPDLKVLEERKMWDKISEMRGIDFNPELFKLNLIELSQYAHECKWTEEPTGITNEFYLNNDCFSYGCASILHSMIRKNKPSKIIEVGSGFSSKIIRDAILINEKEGFYTAYSIIDPYSSIIQKEFPQNTTIIRQPVELIDIEFFTSLTENDILFIDSSHVCKIGSDVNFEILEVLPILHKGVLIHFHDIDLPYEYPKIYATNPKFRMFWTESYLLQAFLSYNKNFEIIIPMRFLQKNDEDTFKRLFPYGNNVKNWSSGSFWIKRIK